MRWVLITLTVILFSFCIEISANASLIVIKDTGQTISSAPYLKNITIPDEKTIMTAIYNQKDKLKNHPIQISKLLYPSKSSFTQGQFKKHRVIAKHFSSTPIFVVGSDDISIKWAHQNAAYLKKIHAFGMITNVDDADQTKFVEQKTGLKLIPTNLDGLQKILGTDHYPLLVYKGWVLQ